VTAHHDPLGGLGFEVMGPTGGNGLGSTFAMGLLACACPAVWLKPTAK